MAIQHVRLRRIGDAADSRVPERLAGRRIVGYKIAGAITGKSRPPAVVNNPPPPPLP